MSVDTQIAPFRPAWKKNLNFCFPWKEKKKQQNFWEEKKKHKNLIQILGYSTGAHKQTAGVEAIFGRSGSSWARPTYRASTIKVFVLKSDTSFIVEARSNTHVILEIRAIQIQSSPLFENRA